MFQAKIVDLDFVKTCLLNHHQQVLQNLIRLRNADTDKISSENDEDIIKNYLDHNIQQVFISGKLTKDIRFYNYYLLGKLNNACKMNFSEGFKMIFSQQI